MAKILVIDDERAIRSTMKEILEFEGYQVDCANDGKEGLKQVEKGNYDLIYCDVSQRPYNPFNLNLNYEKSICFVCITKMRIILISTKHLIKNLDLNQEF